MRRLSATTAFAPPGPRSLAIVISRWRRSISRSFMAVQGRGRCNQGQDYPNHCFRGECSQFARDTHLTAQASNAVASSGKAVSGQLRLQAACTVGFTVLIWAARIATFNRSSSCLRFDGGRPTQP